ncbi:tRNA pseudouridine(55) synthase TruB [Candidatus Uhrbacteria bacterium]|nr:tRNA pseudouridine(55) synthase TruB [Candidatus Uhrbacteria bacterium]
MRRVGHAGTLDPFAEGLLIILVGRESTKQQQQFLGMDKEYEAVIHLGATSTTEDVTGIITPTEVSNFALSSRTKAGEVKGSTQNNRQRGFLAIARNDIKKIISSFIGNYDQMPPAFSAKKINGKKAYELARKGIAPALQPKRVTIHSLEILDYHWPLLTIRCTVSSGTYIRALARDIGEKLECGAYVKKLTRTSIGPYSLQDKEVINL